MDFTKALEDIRKGKKVFEPNREEKKPQAKASEPKKKAAVPRNFNDDDPSAKPLSNMPILLYQQQQQEKQKQPAAAANKRGPGKPSTSKPREKTAPGVRPSSAVQQSGKLNGSESKTPKPPQEEPEWRKELRALTGYDPSQFAHERPGDDRRMEASWDEIRAEERRSAKEAKKEDQIALQEELRKAAEKERKYAALEAQRKRKKKGGQDEDDDWGGPRGKRVSKFFD